MCTARTWSQLSYGQNEFKMDRTFPPDIQGTDIYTIRLKGKRKTSVKLGGILNKCLCDKRRELRWIPWHFHLSPSKGLDFNSSSALIPVSRLDGTNKRWKDHTNGALWNNKEETKRYRGVPRVGGGGWRLPLACIPESGGWKEETGLLAGVGGGLPASLSPPSSPNSSP